MSTWQRDSHELFDFESTNLKRRNLVFDNSSKFNNLNITHLDGIFRSRDNEISTALERDYFMANRQYLEEKLT